MLVAWETGEKRLFSVMEKTKIADGTKRELPKSLLLGKVVQIYWKKKEYPGRIIALGNLCI